MASLYITCLTLLIFHMVSVQTAPKSIRSNDKNNANVLNFDDSNNRSFKSLGNIQNLLNSFAQNSPAEINRYARLTSIDKSSKPLNSLPFLDDIRQNWGILVNQTNLEDEDEESYRRPINIPMPTSDDRVEPTIETSFRELQTKPLLEKTSPAVENGHKKLNVASEVKKTIAKPTSCDVALIVCCMRNSNIEQCFREQECFRQIIPGNVCYKNEMFTALQKVSEYYSLLQ